MSNNTQHDDLLAKWLDGTLSESELELLKETTDLDELRQTLDVVDQLETPPFSAEESWKSFEQKIEKKEATVRRMPRRAYMLVAAAVAAVLLGIFFFLDDSNVQLSVGVDEQTEHTLPDGSVIHLQGPATIEYDSESYAAARNISLKGAAYFEVEKGSDFVVSSAKGSVQVLGTSFDIDARDNFRVFCYTGKVAVSAEDLEEVILEKGQGVIFTAGSTKLITSGMTQPQWLDGTIHMSNADLHEVGDILGDLFGIEVEIEEGIESLYHGPILANDLDQSLDIIKNTLQLNIERVGSDTIKISAY